MLKIPAATLAYLGHDWFSSRFEDTIFCKAVLAVKSQKAELWQLGRGTLRTQIIVKSSPVIVHSMLDFDLRVNPFKTWPWLSSQSLAFWREKLINQNRRGSKQSMADRWQGGDPAFRGKNARLSELGQGQVFKELTPYFSSRSSTEWLRLHNTE